MSEFTSFIHSTIVFVNIWWHVLWILFLLLLIAVSHLLIIRRCRTIDGRVKELVQHQRNLEAWMESVRDALVDGLRK
ncbi:MAG: hypothetical protein OXT71_08975 [Acidobacteriota bacterium]|nr:hypothetical protein [Acidobacteriota bacterium]